MACSVEELSLPFQFLFCIINIHPWICSIFSSRRYRGDGTVIKSAVTRTWHPARWSPMLIEGRIWARKSTYQVCSVGLITTHRKRWKPEGVTSPRQATRWVFQDLCICDPLSSKSNTIHGRCLQTTTAGETWTFSWSSICPQRSLWSFP